MKDKTNVYAGPGMNLNPLGAVDRILENLFNSGYDRQMLIDSISFKLKEIKQAKRKDKVS